MDRKKISAAIITLNEEASLAQTLQSLKFCDEIVVVDSGSIDRTVEIAKSLGAMVIHQKWSGYGKQKKFAVNQTAHAWVLSVDADEVISPRLAQEILKALEKAEYAAYTLPIHTYFLGKDIALWGEKNGHVRLFDKNFAQFSEAEVHEKVELFDPNQKIGHLKGEVFHHSYKNLFEYFEKFNHYTTKASQIIVSKGGPQNIIINFMRYKFRFVYLYIFRGGFRFGRAGYYWCLFSAFYTLVKNAKAYEIVQGQKNQ